MSFDPQEIVAAVNQAIPRTDVSDEQFFEGTEAGESSGQNGHSAAPLREFPPVSQTGPELAVESWRDFERSAGEHVPCLVAGLWPRGALGFISAPPKAGKTWVGLLLALCVATGKPVARFAVPDEATVLYIALEGHKAALRARVGCLARGLGIDPDGDGLARLHWAYKPRGINLASAEWAGELARRVDELNAALVVVDVLRRAAAIKENDAAEFMTLCGYLAPLAEAGRSVALLHHFGKLSEINRDRAPAERMSGSGAMFGALDVGLFITGSEDHARRLRINVESRDLATPDDFGLELVGVGSGENGGFTYQDEASFVIAEPPDETDVKGPAHEIAAFVRGNGGEATPAEIKERFMITDPTLKARRPALARLGVHYIEAGRRSRYVVRSDNADPEPLTPKSSRGDDESA